MHDGIATQHALACMAWVSVIVIGLATQVLTPRPAHGATAPVVLRPVAQAVAAASSYKVTVDQRSTAPTGAGMMTHMEATTVHMEIVVRRRGRLSQLYGVTITRAGTAAPLITAVVSIGTHVCQRFTAAGPWICSLPMSTIVAYLDAIDPVRMLTGDGSRLRLSVTASRRVQGHRCTGYRFTITNRTVGSTAHGFLWLEPATLRPVEVDMVSLTRDTSGNASAMTQQSVWSRWNDRTLTIPAVHAS